MYLGNPIFLILLFLVDEIVFGYNVELEISTGEVLPTYVLGLHLGINLCEATICTGSYGTYVSNE